VAGSWSIEEVEATVTDYFLMLAAELRGERYNKSDHRRRLLQLLDDRSEAAIERKHMNISAVLRELDHPWIDGYKPLENYQHILFEAVERRLTEDAAITELVEPSISDPVDIPVMDDPMDVLSDPPVPETPAVSDYTKLGERKNRIPRKTDYLAREARNRSLGLAGEEFVIQFEAERLYRAGRRRLSERIDHVSRSKGDGLGYDILSFEEDGQERLIEVKTTSFGKRTPFYVSRTELSCSVERESEYHLYRVFRFRQYPGLYWLRGRLDDQFDLNPIQYEARR
jgi:hypothetical protein